MPDGSKFMITDGSNIWLLNSDGSGAPVRIASGIQNQSGYTCYNCVWYRYPEISPDGSKLLVSKQTTNAAGNPGTAGLYMMNIDGSEETPIITGTGLLIKWPSFAPDGKRAAYVKGTQIYRVRGLHGINDCNNNDIPDACDVATTTVPGFCVNYCASPGTCQQSNDCNNNAKPDSCDTDTDSDGTIDECEACPNDPLKQNAGLCGCGNLETDDDNDGTPNCVDSCSHDPLKTDPGVCGCGIPDIDTDNDGHANCIDLCDNDPNKKAPGACGCGNPDTDTDNDTTPDCIDACPNDPAKIAIGLCGCGVSDVDGDNDSVPNCNDACSNDPLKNEPGVCGCGIADSDTNGNGTADCIDSPGVTCTEVDISTFLSAIEAACSKEYNYTNQALALFRKAKGKTKLATKYQKTAKSSLLTCKNFVAAFPKIILSNCNSSHCAGMDQSTNRSGLMSSLNNLTNLTKKILTQTIKLKKTLKPIASKLSTKAIALNKTTTKTIDMLPASTEKCE